MEVAVGKVANVTQKTAAESGRLKSAGNAAKTMTVHLAKTARTENVSHLEPVVTAVVKTQTVRLITAAESGRSKSAGNAAKTMTVHQAKTARTGNVLHLEPMEKAVVPTLTVLLATAVVSRPSRNVENAARMPTAPQGDALRGPAELLCPKVPSARRTRTANLDAVLEKFTYGRVVHALAKENHVVYHKESGALRSEWLVANPTPAKTRYLEPRYLM